MQVEKFTNRLLSSNTYIVSKEDELGVWIVDPGDSARLIGWLADHRKDLSGILLTHSHIDHIYGINDLRREFKDVVVYASIRANEGLFCIRSNGSYYTGAPYILENENIIYVNHEDSIDLWDGISAIVYDTPGHNDDCISFFSESCLFTGDALVPGVKVHLKSKNASRTDAYRSIAWIRHFFDGEVVVYPGHRDACKLREISIDS